MLLYTSKVHYLRIILLMLLLCHCVLCPYTAQCAQQCLAAFSIPPHHHVNWKACLNSLHVLETRQQKQSWRASQSERTTQHPHTPLDAMLLPTPPVVLEKSGCCNAVTEAKLLSLVHTSTQNRKYPFYERGGWRNQRDVLCNIIPTRQVEPTVMPELPQILPGVSVRS